jgi:L-asparagine transporter-like permease
MFKLFEKLGFTDKYGVIASIITAIFLFCCLGIFTFTDKDPIAYAGLAIGFLGTIVSFIVTKNQKENAVKIEKWGKPNGGDGA